MAKIQGTIYYEGRKAKPTGKDRKKLLENILKAIDNTDLKILAHKMGKSQLCINQMHAGVSIPSPKTLLALAKARKVPLEELVADTCFAQLFDVKTFVETFDDQSKVTTPPPPPEIIEDAESKVVQTSAANGGSNGTAHDEKQKELTPEDEILLALELKCDEIFSKHAHLCEDFHKQSHRQAKKEMNEAMNATREKLDALRQKDQNFFLTIEEELKRRKELLNN